AATAGNDIFGRRVLFAGLFATTFAGSLALAALALSPGGFSIIDITLLALFALTLPWMVAGFWKAVIGFLIMRFSADAVSADLASRWCHQIPITYRRRAVNTAYKAGNIREFCARWGSKHDFAVTLDADSFMSADAILRMVRIMQADPKLGILQGLIGGLPST